MSYNHNYGWTDTVSEEWLKNLTKETIKPKECEHEWIPIRLVYTTVYDCKKCQAKKEKE